MSFRGCSGDFWEWRSPALPSRQKGPESVPMVRPQPGATTGGCPQRPPKPPPGIQSLRPNLMPVPPATAWSCGAGLPLVTSCTPQGAAGHHSPDDITALLTAFASSNSAPHPTLTKELGQHVYINLPDTLFPVPPFLLRGSVSRKERIQSAGCFTQVGLMMGGGEGGEQEEWMTTVCDVLSFIALFPATCRPVLSHTTPWHYHPLQMMKPSHGEVR